MYQEGKSAAQHADRVRKDIKASSVTFLDTNSYLPFIALLSSYIALVHRKKSSLIQKSFNIWLLVL